MDNINFTLVLRYWELTVILEFPLELHLDLTTGLGLSVIDPLRPLSFQVDKDITSIMAHSIPYDYFQILLEEIL